MGALKFPMAEGMAAGYDLLDRFRDLILLDAVPDAAARGLIDAPQDLLAQAASGLRNRPAR